MSAAKIGPNLFHQARIVSWLMSMPRSCSRSSTFLNESGNPTYIIAARRITSDDVLKYRNGLAFIPPASEAKSAASELIPLTMPLSEILRFVRDFG